MSAQTTLRDALATGFRALSAARGGRALHPRGVAFEGEILVDPEPASGARGTELFARAGTTQPVVVRFSRAVGLPEPLPDFHGAALRFPSAYGPGRHQDLLFTTGGSAGLARHLLVPTTGFGQSALSTLAPYALGGRRAVLLLRIGGRPGSVRALRGGLGRDAGSPALELLEAPPISGPVRRIGRISLGERLSAEAEAALRFNPAHTGGGIEPVSLVNWLRPPSYRASEDERPVAGGRR